MILHKATLKNGIVNFHFSSDGCEVAMWVPYDKILDSVPDSGDLEEMVRVYVSNMFNVASLLE